jgi:F-type H+-transporting ATPase subunit epsilon
MKVYINTVFEEIYSGDAKEVVLPGDEGELSLMDFHQPIVCRLISGVVKIIPPKTKASEGPSLNSVKSIQIVDGIAHMEGDTLNIMAEVA